MKPIVGLIIILLSAVNLGCAGNHRSESAGSLPDREQTVGFFSNIHTFVRDTERGVYDLMYGIRDGTDSFIYDNQKDYYENYQK